MSAEEEIARQALQERERLDIILGDLGVFGVPIPECSRRSPLGLADNDRVECSAALFNLHRPGGTSFCMAGSETGGQLGATELDDIAACSVRSTCAPGRPRAVLCSSATSGSITMSFASVSLRMTPVAAS